MSPQDFDFAPPGKFAQLFPLLLGLLLPLVMLVAIGWNRPDRHDWLTAAPAVLILPVVAAGFAWSLYRRTVRVTDDSLRFGALPWRRTRLAALDLDAARIVDLDRERELQPVIRIAGTTLPGYRSGWFRLRNRQRAYVVLSDWKRVLVLPKRDGGMILLSPRRPEALLAALKRGRG